MVVEVPHAGLAVDPEALATIAAPARSLGMDADLYVDELYADAPAAGATLLVSTVSRYACDLNRAETDVDAMAVTGGDHPGAPHGLIWRMTTTGIPALHSRLTQSEYERRLDRIYRPYHSKLRSLLKAKKDRFGFVILLAAHSMPSAGRSGHKDTGFRRADIVPGSRGRTTAASAVIDAPDELARTRNWSVAHDAPYRGGFTTAHYGCPDAGSHAVQVELNRALYMHEATLTRLPGGFRRTKEYCSDLVRALGALGPQQLRL